MPPAANRPRTRTCHSPKAAVGEGSPTAGLGMTALMHMANDWGRCPPLCGPNTEQLSRETPWAVLAQPTKGKEKELERDTWGHEEDKGGGW